MNDNMKELTQRILIFSVLFMALLILLSIMLPEGLEKGTNFIDELKAIFSPPITLSITFIFFN